MHLYKIGYWVNREVVGSPDKKMSCKELKTVVANGDAQAAIDLVKEMERKGFDGTWMDDRVMPVGQTVAGEKVRWRGTIFELISVEQLIEVDYVGPGLQSQ
ncbi:MAG: hypothetical protein ACRDGM_13865 [bacterium]